MKLFFPSFCALLLPTSVLSFQASVFPTTPLPSSVSSSRLQRGGSRSWRPARTTTTTKTTIEVPRLSSRSPDDNETTTAVNSSDGSGIEVKVTEETVGNLVANDEWEGLTMELSELIRTAVVEDIKNNARDFLGKDDYKLGDISKEVDTRVKAEVANLRNKDSYELGDLSIVMDEWAKERTSELTGKPYEAGDLSKELDQRVKRAVADWCGKDEYQVGDLTKEVTKRVKNRVSDYLGKEYEFGDITREVENRRRAWVKEYLGAEAAEDYQFGDITKKALAGFVGKEEYQFGDITKKLMGGLFKKKD